MAVLKTAGAATEPIDGMWVAVDRLGHLLGALAAGVDGHEPVTGVVHVGGQRHQHDRDLVVGRVLALRTGRDRYAGDERVLGQLAPIIEIGPKGAGHDGQHHVVHLDAVMVLDRLHVLHRQRAEAQTALRADTAVEGGVRYRHGHDPPTGAGLGDHGDAPLHRTGRVLHRSQGRHQRRDGGAGEELQIGRRGPGSLDLLVGRHGWWFGIRGEVQQRGGQTGSGHAIEEAVVVLHQDRHPVVGKAFDEPVLPQRIAAVDLSAEDPAAERGEFLHAPGGRQGRVMEMPIDVEVLVVDPHRPIEAEGHLVELPHELRRQRQPSGQHLAHGQVVEVGCLAAIHDREPAHMLMPGGHLHRQEEGVGSAQSSHETKATARDTHGRPHGQAPTRGSGMSCSSIDIRTPSWRDCSPATRLARAFRPRPERSGHVRPGVGRTPGRRPVRRAERDNRGPTAAWSRVPAHSGASRDPRAQPWSGRSRPPLRPGARPAAPCCTRSSASWSSLTHATRGRGPPPRPPRPVVSLGVHATHPRPATDVPPPRGA